MDLKWLAHEGNKEGVSMSHKCEKMRIEIGKQAKNLESGLR